MSALSGAPCSDFARGLIADQRQRSVNWCIEGRTKAEGRASGRQKIRCSLAAN
jgi:hypothetical protein